MNKKANTVLFILGATVFNLILITLLMLLSLVLISVIFRNSLGATTLSILLMVLFIGSIAATFLIYRWVLNLISRKFDLEKYLLPLFKRRKR